MPRPKEGDEQFDHRLDNRCPFSWRQLAEVAPDLWV
jgi:hypothetical protein